MTINYYLFFEYKNFNNSSKQIITINRINVNEQPAQQYFHDSSIVTLTGASLPLLNHIQYTIVHSTISILRLCHLYYLIMLKTSIHLRSFVIEGIPGNELSRADLQLYSIFQISRQSIEYCHNEIDRPWPWGWYAHFFFHRRDS